MGQSEQSVTRLIQKDQKQEKDLKGLCGPSNLVKGPDTLLTPFLGRKTSSCLGGRWGKGQPFPSSRL